MPDSLCSCNKPHTEEMVECDLCKLWFHFECVGVTEEIDGKDWNCPTCNNKIEMIVAARLAVLQNRQSNDVAIQSEQETEKNKQILAEVHNSPSVENAGHSDDEDSQYSDAQLSKEKLLLQHLEELSECERKQQEDELEMERRRRAHERSMRFIKKKFEILQGKRNDIYENYTLKPSTFVDTNKTAIQPPILNDRCRYGEMIVPATKDDKITTANVVKEVQQFEELSKQNKLARKILGEDLPIFSGNVMEWPLFLMNFEESTLRGGYSNWENRTRLDKCLKPPAREIVKELLIFPENVPVIIQNLKRVYERPHEIIDAMYNQIENIAPVPVNNLDKLIKFSIKIKNLCAMIRASGKTAHYENATFLRRVTAKLPMDRIIQWTVFCKSYDKPINLLALSVWLDEQAGVASEAIEISGISSGITNANSFRRLDNPTKSSVVQKKVINAHTSTPTKEVQEFSQVKIFKCKQCDREGHSIFDCEEFRNLGYDERWKVVKSKRLCYCCLKFHPSSRCFRRQICAVNGCDRKHHRLLHNEVNETSNKKTDEVVEKGCNSHQAFNTDILLKILPVTLHGPTSSVKTYAFLDDGSTVTLFESAVAEKLGLEGPKQNLCLTWTNDVSRIEKDSKRVSVEVSGKDGERYRMDNVRTVKKLDLPTQTIQLDHLQDLQHLRGLDIDCYQNAKPTILIGMDQTRLNTTLKVREGCLNEPSAFKTRLGWVICGTTGENIDARVLMHRVKNCVCQQSDESLHQLVKGYFALETDGIQIKTMESKDEERARSIMEATTSKIEGQDRFETGLVWRFDDIEMPNSYFMALRRLKCLESKMSREPELAKNLCQQMEEYVENGYARKLSREESNVVTPRTWILPIFAVQNVNKPNKKRIVWDAAAEVEGISLNKMLLKGPDLLCSLMTILFRFRQRPVGICGDIKHMFHQVKIRKEDQDSQRFLWRDGDTSREPDQYVMTVMTFGASCSPSSSQFVKNKNAEFYRQDMPRAVEAIVSSHYVDDLLDSVDSESEAIQLANDVKFIHSRAGFLMRNWLSNSREVMIALGELQTDDVKSLNSSCEPDKILGMWWNTTTDSFCFKLNQARIDTAVLSGEKRPTKRELLRTLMAIYDPLGLIAILLINIKVLMQCVWRAGIGWDEELPDELYEQWLRWSKLLLMVPSISIPRCYVKQTHTDGTKLELHLFSDASESAYATVAYIRICNLMDFSVTISLIGAKTKVAPMHSISIPRMELQGALLSARFSKAILDGHTIKFDEVIYWSDSEVVLRWLRSDHRKYKQYVALRVGEISQLTDAAQWRYVPSSLNVADDATKWGQYSFLHAKSRWFTGPEFLYKHPNEWPFDKTRKMSDPDEELKMSLLVHGKKRICLGVMPDPNRIERWQIFVRALALVLRFVDKLKAKVQDRKQGGNTKTLTCSPTPQESERAEHLIFRYIQREAYPDEIIMLENDPMAKIPKDSPIRKYTPYLDEAGVLRHKGRIDAAYGIPEEAKRPIIIPRKHPVTQKLIHHYHAKWKHAHFETVINELRQRFLIPKVRVALREVRHRCQKCKIDRAKPQPPQMGDLPYARLSPYTDPFTFTGVDLFGPMEVAIGRRVEKRWGVLFTCLNIRAVHVELADSLEADALILCIRNFINRRGEPVEMYSDNGTNMHGANNEIQKSLQQLPDKLQDKFERMRWKFNPPASPHMGGCWERLVQSIKKVLKTTLPTRRPTTSLLQSMLIEAEAIVNARPLTHVSVDPDEPTAITPNHFLLRSSRGTKSIGQFSDKDALLKKNWRRSQWFGDLFWKRWIKEYLPTIITREKWLEKVDPIKVGDLVVICDDKVRNSWQRGMVVGVQPGSGNQVRSVQIRTSAGLYSRPSTKVAVLDVVDGKIPSEGTYEGENVVGESDIGNCLLGQERN